jgi:hypothetical protein
LIKWTNNAYREKGESLSNYLYAVSRAWTSPSKWPTPEVFINVCIEWEQKKGNKSGHRCRLRSIIIRFSFFVDRIFFLISTNFFYFRKITSIISCPHACAIVVIHINIYIESFDRVWWMESDIWSYACLLMFMSFLSRPENRRREIEKNITMKQLYKQNILELSSVLWCWPLSIL